MTNFHIAVVNKVSTLVQTKEMDKTFGIRAGGVSHQIVVKGKSPQELSEGLTALRKEERPGKVYTASMLNLPFVQEDIEENAKKVHLVFDQDNGDLVFLMYTV